MRRAGVPPPALRPASAALARAQPRAGARVRAKTPCRRAPARAPGADASTAPPEAQPRGSGPVARRPRGRQRETGGLRA
eukprot:8400273-Lingulodinium_polyedra.AAC.1